MGPSCSPDRAGTIRLIDALVLTKGNDGIVDATELSDVAELDELQQIEKELAELLAADDVAHVAWIQVRPPMCASGRTCGPRPSRSPPTVRVANLIANGRIAVQAIIASIDAADAAMTQGA